jgi:hypothetical protein
MRDIMAALSNSQTDERALLLRQPTPASAASVLHTATNTTSDHFRSDLHHRSATDYPHDEETVRNPTNPAYHEANISVARIVSVLLIGSFISNADGSLFYATHPIIASEFNAIEDSTWLMTSFALAQAVTQPMYGN